MDCFTTETKNWLDERFCQTTEEGIYYAHQPIYGFRDKNCEQYIINRYALTYHIMKELEKFNFNSLLDVGGAEGYKAALVREIFDCEVRSCDLSSEAVKRAKEIFNVDGEPVDIHVLPYNDNEFDVVLCSETLEHVKDIGLATRELIRVSKRAVVITVPHESQELVDRNIKEEIPHAHIHSLDLDSFDFTLNEIKRITKKKVLHPIINFPAAICEAAPKQKGNSSYSNIAVLTYNSLIPLFRSIVKISFASSLIKFDEYLSNTNLQYSGIVFVLFKDNSIAEEGCKQKITPKTVLNFQFPHYYLK